MANYKESSAMKFIQTVSLLALVHIVTGCAAVVGGRKQDFAIFSWRLQRRFDNVFTDWRNSH